ncbi:uncharacterized protein [Trachinotus anak]
MIIEEMLKLSEQTEEDTTILVDEILHSIFFLGVINSPRCSPKDIVRDKKKLKELKTLFPNPFKFYSSQLPKRSPISFLLDMIVHLIGQENEDKIIQMLRDFISKLSRGKEGKPLISFAIGISQKNKSPDAVRYYGVSMSTSGRIQGKIMVAASCLSAWDSRVADAIMTYIPDKSKKPYFDGTIKLPQSVRCEVFSLSRMTKMPPCITCGNLFGLQTIMNERSKGAHGHCAEAESLSNLFKNEDEVKMQAQPASETCTDENRQRAKDYVLKHLKNFLKTVNFRWDNTFYMPDFYFEKSGVIDY